MTGTDQKRPYNGDHESTCTQHSITRSFCPCAALSADLSTSPGDDVRSTGSPLIGFDSEGYSTLENRSNYECVSVSSFCDVYSADSRGLDDAINIQDSDAHTDSWSVSISEGISHVDDAPVASGNSTIPITPEGSLGPIMPTLTPRELRASRRASQQERASQSLGREPMPTFSRAEYERLCDQVQVGVRGPHSCPVVGCGMLIGQSTNLKRHLATHIHKSEKRQPKCPTCGRLLSREDALRRHMSMHAGDSVDSEDLDPESESESTPEFDTASSNPNSTLLMPTLTEGELYSRLQPGATGRWHCPITNYEDHFRDKNKLTRHIQDLHLKTGHTYMRDLQDRVLPQRRFGSS